MCLAIYKPADTTPDWSAYANGFYDNPHSWGFAVIVDGQLVTRCGIGTFNEFRTTFEPYANCKAIIHFRFATHGSKTVPNCHPFLVSDDLAVIHNGIVSIECSLHKDRSDTWHFNELVLKPMHMRDPDFFLRPEVRYTQELAHRGSKFVFLRADGMHEIWCESDGHWETDGHWYSNTGYRRSRYTYYSYEGVDADTGASMSSHRDMSPPAYDDESMTSQRERDLDASIDERELMAAYGIEDERCTLIRDPMSPHDTDTYTLEELGQTLIDYGYSESCLREIYDISGRFGLELLIDSL